MANGGTIFRQWRYEFGGSGKRIPEHYKESRVSYGKRQKIKVDVK